MPRNHIPRVPADRAHAHVEKLRRQFPTCSISHMARLAGLAQSVLSERVKPGKLIYAETEEMILAVRPEHVRLMPPPFMPAEPLRRHLTPLLQLPHVSAWTLSKSAGVDGETVRNVLRGQATVQTRIYRALMALTPETATIGRYYVDAAPYVTMVRALMAQRWSLEDQSAMCGHHVGGIVHQGHKGVLFAHKARAIEEMYHRVGDTYGPESNAKCATYARRAGYWPAMHYDEDMQLIPESLPNDDDEREGEQQELGRRGLVSLGLAMRGKFPRDAGEVLGIDREAAGKYRERCGLRTVRNADEFRCVLAEGQGALLDAIAVRVEDIDLAERTDAYDRRGIDYYARYEELRTGAWATALVRPRPFKLGPLSVYTEEAIAA